jgi:methyltransferase (TIGR00027 family)
VSAVNPVANTARWTAAIRACETERHDRLFDDPLARALAGDEGFRLLGPTGPEVADVGVYVSIRTKFFDDFIMRASTSGLRQVVLLAAGMDARAFRLAWPSETTVFELDSPELLAAKNGILAREGAQPRCRRVSVPVDLSEVWGGELRNKGFDRLEPALWIAEGLFFYLDPPVVYGLQEELSGLAAPGSRLGADFVSESFLTSPWMRGALASLEARGMKWRSGTDHPEAMLVKFGWQADVRQPGEEGVGEGRWPHPVFPRSFAEVPHSLLVTAVKN